MNRKSIISTIVVALSLLGAAAAFSQSANGDVNGDGGVTIVDALMIAQYYVGLSPNPFNQGNADANCSGSIDIVDALLVAQYYVGLIGQFAQCGQATAAPTPQATATPVQDPGQGIYLSPSGSDSNSGSSSSPLYSLSVAVGRATAGTTIYMAAGTYNYSSMITLSASGTTGQNIRILSQGGKAVLDFSAQEYASSNRAILLTGNYWYIKGLEIRYAGDNGIKLEGNYNTIEQCVFHHNGDSGIQLGFAHETSNDGSMCAYNTIINCDSYYNFDFDSKGGDADGFACKMHQGKGNVFKGCRAWHNSDDGWDLYETDWPVEIYDCWTWGNGFKADFDAIYQAKMGTTMSSFSGNGNGFKLGGNGTGGSSKGTHVVKNCVAFNNNAAGRTAHGFDQNSHADGVTIYNCLAYNNLYDFFFEESTNSGKVMTFANCVSLTKVAEMGSTNVQQNNSWNLSVTATTADFADLSEATAGAARQSDGSLPSNSFARLVAGSDLIDKGANVGTPFKGSAPDLGAFEY